MNPRIRPRIKSDFGMVLNPDGPPIGGVGKPGKRPPFIQRNARVRHAERPQFAGTVKDAGVHRYAMVMWDGAAEPRECDYVRLIPEAGYVEPEPEPVAAPKQAKAAAPRAPRAYAPKAKKVQPLPEKHCAVCQKRLELSTYRQGTMESRGQYMKRQTCSVDCRNKLFEGPRVAVPERNCTNCAKPMQRRMYKGGHYEHPTQYAVRKYCDACRHIGNLPVNKLSDEKRAAILADVHTGSMKMIHIAAKHGVAVSTVSKIAAADWRLKAKAATT